MRHETSRNTRATGATAAAGDRSGEGRADAVGGGAPVLRLGEFGVPLVAGVRARGARGLRPKPTPGRPSRLSPGEKAKLVTLLGHGPLRAGYRTDLWTLPRVAALIRQQFGVRYHPAHVWKVLTGLGWSCQKPERRAVERDEPAIARWKRSAWPRIKKRRPPGRPPRVRR